MENEKTSNDSPDVIDTEFKEVMNKIGNRIIIISIIAYIVTVFPLMYMDITEITMHVVGFVTLSLALPLSAFLIGMWVVWKKKFFPTNEAE